MAEVAKGIVDIEINTGAASAQLKALQQQISAFNLAVNKNNTFQTQAISNYTTLLKDVVNSSKFFTAETVRMKTSAGALDATLKKGRGSLSQFFSAKFNKNSAMFAETMALSSERARSLQTQFIATSGASKGMQDALAIRPLAAFNSQMAIAAQKSQILTQMFRQGTTQLVNFGKNVQWAGRQLMVGFTLPLTVFGTTAGKVFMDLEKQAVNFKKVYGDLFTPPGELEQNLEAVTKLAQEYTKYGIAVKDTIGLAAEAAAAGRTNQELIDATTQATRLGTLGQMDQAQALETTIALQSAFRLSGEDLANTINFLNMVENQTVVTLQDLAAAIPRVAPVIRGLGGDVQDMAVFLAAMQEGGVSAEQGANALKSGLASLINPTKQAKEMLFGFNINLDAIIQKNRGDLMGTVTDFAKVLQTLDDFSRQQVLEQVFGKFQYARLGALFDNIIRDGSQANQVLQATAFSAQELAQSAEKELSAIEQSVGVQLTGAMERFKLAIAPIGQMFVELAIPIVNFLTKIIEGFNNLPDFQKKFILMATVITGLVIPAGTMFFGLLMNLSGQLLKLVQSIGIFAKGMMSKGGVIGGIQAVTQSMKYLSLEEIDAAIAAKQLGSATEVTNQAFRNQVTAAQGARVAVADLASVYSHLINQMAKAASMSGVTLGTSGAAMNLASRQIKGASPRLKFARGGSVPGSGNTDTVPAMLMPGEFVVNKKATQNIGKGFLERLNKGGVAGYQGGGWTEDSALSRYEQMSGKTKLQPSSKSTKSVGKVSRVGSFATLLQTFLSQKGSTKKGSIINWANSLGIKTNLTSRGNFGFLMSDKTNKLMAKSGIDVKTVTSELGMPGAYIPVQKQFSKYFKNTHNFDEAAFRRFQLEEFSKVRGSVLTNRTFEKSSRNALRRYMDEKGFSRVERNSFIRDITNKVHVSANAKREDILSNLNSKGINYKLGTNKKDIFVNINGKEENVGRILLGYETGSLKQTSPIQSFKSLKTKGDERVFAHANKGGMMGGDGRLVPSLLTPGEFVVGRDAAAANRPFLEALNSGSINKFEDGGPVYGPMTRREAAAERLPQIKRAGRVATVSGGLGRLGGALGAAALPALIIGPMLQQSSNQLAQTIGQITTGLLPVLFALPLLKGVLPKLGMAGGLVTAGLLAVGALTSITVIQMKKLNDSSAALTRAMYGGSESIKNFSEAYGRQTFAEQNMAARAAQLTGPVSEEAQQFSSQFMQAEQGQELIKQIEEVQRRGGDAVIALRNQLAQSIVAGLITPEEARIIAADVGMALNDEELAVNAVGKINSLFGPNGEKLENNRMKIIAEITPQINVAEIMAQAEESYQQDTGFFAKLFGSKEDQINAIAQNDLIEKTRISIENYKNSIAGLENAYRSGEISLADYEKEVGSFMSQIDLATSDSLESFAEIIGVSVYDLQELSKEMVKTGKGSGFTERAKEIQEFFAAQKSGVESILAPLGEEASGKIIQGIIDMTGGEGPETAKIFSQMLTGNLSPDLLAQITEFMRSGDLKEFADVFTRMFKISIPMSQKDIDFVNDLKGIPGDIAKIEPDDTVGEDLTGGQKSRIQSLEESLALTKQQTLATQYLITRGLKPEALASLDAATAVDIMNNKRTDLIKKLNEQATAQRLIAVLGKLAEDREIDRLDLESRVADQRINGIQKQIDAVERQNELDQRQVSIRQKALDDISKKEDALNQQYDARFTALDKVARINDRLAQQERSRISLASALSSGDIGSAVFAASEMTRSFAESQAEDARSSLEYMREQELSNITANVNGQFLTREQIQAQIDGINERIYQRQLSTIPLEDQLYAYNQEKERIANRIEQIQINMQAKQIEEEQALARQLGLLKGKKRYARDIRDYYAQAVSLMNSLGGRAVTAMYGGSIQKKSFGGLLKYTSNEPAPGMAMGGRVKKFAIGNIVPGMGNVDRVPALLTPGEFVVRKSVAQANMPLLQALNSDVFPTMSGGVPSVDPGSLVSNSIVTNNTPVYNYSISVNVPNTNASPEEIANVVASRLNRINSTSIRGGRRIG